MTGLSAGSISYFLSFNHDTNRFEIVATGTVSADGSTIISDPGVGISVAGWGCNCPPYAVAGACINCAVDCLETGSLSEGEGAVDKSLVCVGESITFSVTTDSVDNGGIKQFNCPDSTITDFDGPVAPSYSWVISGPGALVSGNGSAVTFTPPTNGTYSCQFTATANRDCPPDPVTFNGGSVTTVAVTSISGPTEVAIGTPATFTAIGGPFPVGHPVWSGGVAQSSNVGDFSYTTQWNTIGEQTVSVKCGSSVQTLEVTVVEVISVITSPVECVESGGTTFKFSAITNPPGFGGVVLWSAANATPSSGRGSTFTTAFDLGRPTSPGIFSTTATAGTSSVNQDVTAVEVASLEVTNAEHIDEGFQDLDGDGQDDDFMDFDGDGEDDTSTWVICVDKDNPNPITTAMATPNPNMPDNELPGCWSFTGATNTGKKTEL